MASFPDIFMGAEWWRRVQKGIWAGCYRSNDRLSF